MQASKLATELMLRRCDIIFRIEVLALRAHRGSRLKTHEAHGALRPACAGEKSDHDFRQAKFDFWIIRDETLMRGQTDF